MSVLIKGMEMPKCCAECDAEGHYENSYGEEYGFFCPFGYKAYTEETRDAKRLDNCPLVHVPPHGRLVDADRLLSEQMKQKYYHLPNGDTAIPIIDVEHAPTAIEKEEVYSQYTDTAGNFHWCGTHSGEHTIKAEEKET